jgi:hypothetical protein
LLLLTGVTIPLFAQLTKAEKQYQDRVLGVQALSGQIVAVVPSRSSGGLGGQGRFRPVLLPEPGRRTAALRLALRRVHERVLLETKWVLPDELRKISVRSSGYFPDPDLMGQGALRNPNIRKKVPEPLQSKLRSISGVTNARVIIIPAGVVFSRDSTGMLAAAVSVVLTDPRLGDIKYRTITTGKGVTPDAALRAAFAIMVPPESLPE